MSALDPGRSFCIGVPGVLARSSFISAAALNWPCRTAFGCETDPALGGRSGSSLCGLELATALLVTLAGAARAKLGLSLNAKSPFCFLPLVPLSGSWSGGVEGEEFGPLPFCNTSCFVLAWVSNAALSKP